MGLAHEHDLCAVRFHDVCEELAVFSVGRGGNLVLGDLKHPPVNQSSVTKANAFGAVSAEGHCQLHGFRDSFERHLIGKFEQDGISVEIRITESDRGESCSHVPRHPCAPPHEVGREEQPLTGERRHSLAGEFDIDTQSIRAPRETIKAGLAEKEVRNRYLAENPPFPFLW